MSVGGLFRAGLDWIAGENPGSAKMASQIKGLYDDLQGTFDGTSFTPTITGTGGNPNLGASATKSCRFFRIGLLVFYEMHLWWSPSGTVTAGGGTYDISLPVTARYSTGSSPSFMCGQARLFLAGPTNLKNGICRLQNGSPPTLRVELDDSTGFMTATNPWAPSNSAQIDLHGWYEAAP